MSKLILEFGCSSCYLEGLGCGTTCIKEDVKNELGNFSSISSIDKFNTAHPSSWSRNKNIRTA